MSEPTKPGYYWAKLNGLERWEIVEIRLGPRCGPDRPRELLGYMLGKQRFYYAGEFTFGPEVTKPEGLEPTLGEPQ